MKTYKLLFFGPEQKVIADFLKEQKDYIEIFDDTKVDFLFINGDVFKMHPHTLVPLCKRKILVTGEICNLIEDFDIVCCPNYSNNPKIIYFNQFLLNSLPFLQSRNIAHGPLRNSTPLFLYSNGFPYFRRYFCRALQAHISVDCLGSVMNNKKRISQRSSQYIDSAWENDKKIFLQSYKYCLACENSFAPGYISEKLWHCLETGSIPIYLGALDIASFIPQDCYIDVRSYMSRWHFLFLEWLLRLCPHTMSRKYGIIRRIEWMGQRILGMTISWGKIARSVLAENNKRGLTPDEINNLKRHEQQFFSSLRSALDAD